MSLAYRAMQAADLDAIMAIEVLAHESPWTLGNFNDSLKSGHQATVMHDVTHENSALQGYAVVMPLPEEAELLNITIAPTQQRRGLGALLLNEVCQAAQQQGATRMFLEVRASNAPAIALYTQHGFAQVGLRRAYYACQDGQREDAILMAKELVSQNL